MVEHVEKNQRVQQSRLPSALSRGVVVVVLAGLAVGGCSGAASPGSAPSGAPDGAAAAAPTPPQSTEQRPAGDSPSASPGDGWAGAPPPGGSASASPDEDNARPSGAPAPPLPNPLTTPLAKAVRGEQPTSPSIPAAAAESAFSDTVSYRDGVTLRITRARGAAEDGHGPGVFPGREYVAVDLEITNGSSTPVDLSSVVVSAYYGDAKQLAPAVYTAGGETADLTGTVQPGGGKATGTYAFAIPKSELNNVTMVVDFDSAHASAVYSGKVTLS